MAKSRWARNNKTRWIGEHHLPGALAKVMKESLKIAAANPNPTFRARLDPTSADFETALAELYKAGVTGDMIEFIEPYAEITSMNRTSLFVYLDRFDPSEKAVVNEMPASGFGIKFGSTVFVGTRESLEEMALAIEEFFAKEERESALKEVA